MLLSPPGGGWGTAFGWQPDSIHLRSRGQVPNKVACVLRYDKRVLTGLTAGGQTGQNSKIQAAPTASKHDEAACLDSFLYHVCKFFQTDDSL